MLAIDIELLFETIRAGSPDDLAAAGGADPGEWPPSPARLFSALVAADGTGDRSRATTGEELLALEGAGPPVIVCDRSSIVLRSPQLPRFVVVDATDESTVQEYPARSSKEARRGPRLCPENPRLSYVWESFVPAAKVVAFLRARAARIGYLGCADSPVRVRVRVTEDPDEVGSEPDRWKPDPSGDANLPVPYPGFTADLDQLFEQFTAGAWVRRSWLAPVRARYRSPDALPAAATKPIVIWLRFDHSVAGRRALAVTEALRGATLRAFDQVVAGGSGNLPPVLTGHGFTEDNWDQALYVALPHIDAPFADGRIHGAAVVLPGGTSSEILEGTRAALWTVSELHLQGGSVVRTRLHGGETRPFAANPGRWIGPAAHFVSAFPVVHERFRKGGPTPSDVAEWCVHAGLPLPTWFRMARQPLVEGAIALRPHEVNRVGRPARPYSHLEIRFPQAVPGPVVLGRGRSFGLGLMAPVTRRQPGPVGGADA